MEQKDKAILEFLKDRTGRPTIAKMKDGSLFTIWNIVWGYDLGDEYSHITTNVNPRMNDAETDFFFTYDIAEFIDPESGTTITLPLPGMA